MQQGHIIFIGDTDYIALVDGEKVTVTALVPLNLWQKVSIDNGVASPLNIIPVPVQPIP